VQVGARHRAHGCHSPGSTSACGQSGVEDAIPIANGDLSGGGRHERYEGVHDARMSYVAALRAWNCSKSLCSQTRDAARFHRFRALIEITCASSDFILPFTFLLLALITRSLAAREWTKMLARLCTCTPIKVRATLHVGQRACRTPPRPCARVLAPLRANAAVSLFSGVCTPAQSSARYSLCDRGTHALVCRHAGAWRRWRVMSPRCTCAGAPGAAVGRVATPLRRHTLARMRTHQQQRAVAVRTAVLGDVCPATWQRVRAPVRRMRAPPRRGNPPGTREHWARHPPAAHP
jgi:hypothetical protein